MSDHKCDCDICEGRRNGVVYTAGEWGGVVQCRNEAHHWPKSDMAEVAEKLDRLNRERFDALTNAKDPSDG